MLDPLAKLGPWFDWLFPSSCVTCQTTIHNQAGICELCLQDLPLFDLTAHRNLLQRPDIADSFADCQFDVLISCAWYRWPFKQWLKQLKFSDQVHFKKALQRVILYQLHSAQSQHDNWPDVFIILPLHKQRYLTRGYNQVSQTWLPCLQKLNCSLSHALIKHKATQAQSQLSRAKRVKNLSGAFICEQDMHGKTVAIVDDIMTSAATLNAATSALKQAGAKRVWAFTTCLTPLGGDDY